MHIVLSAFLLVIVNTGSCMLCNGMPFKNCTRRKNMYYPILKECLKGGKLAVYSSYECAPLLDRQACKEEGGRLVFDPDCMAAKCSEDGCSEENPFLLTNGSCVKSCGENRFMFTDYTGVSECICNFQDGFYQVEGQCYRQLTNVTKGRCNDGEVIKFKPWIDIKNISIPFGDLEFSCCPSVGKRMKNNEICEETPFIRGGIFDPCRKDELQKCITTYEMEQNLDFVLENFFR